MQGRILNQEATTNLKRPEQPEATSLLAKTSALGPSTAVSYQRQAFRDLVDYKPKLIRKPEEFLGWVSVGKTPVAPPGGIAPEPVSYYNIENNSTYYEVIGSSTYYEVVY